MSCSPSGEKNCINTASGNCHSVLVAVSCAGWEFTPALISQIYFVMKLYMFLTVRLSIIRSLITLRSVMLYVCILHVRCMSYRYVDSFTAGTGRNSNCEISASSWFYYKGIIFINVETSLHYSQKLAFFSVTQQPKSGLGGLIDRLWGIHTHARARTHSYTHTRTRRHLVELL